MCVWVCVCGVCVGGYVCYTFLSGTNWIKAWHLISTLLRLFVAKKKVI